MRRAALLLVLGFIAAGRVASSQSVDDCQNLSSFLELPWTTSPLPTVECRIDRGCLSVDWNIIRDQPLTETLALFRFTEKTPLRIHTSNVNQLYFRADWTKTVEPPNPSFEFVASLFDQVFPILGAIGATVSLSSTDPLMMWVRSIEYGDACLSATLAEFTDIVIDRDGTVNRDRLYRVSHLLQDSIQKLREQRAKAFDSVGQDSLDTYWRIAERHTRLEARIAEFVPLARATVEGVSTVIEPQKRNSTVVLIGRAVRRNGEAVGDAVVARYFVGTSRPLYYHVGYGLGRLKAIDFEQVRSLSGQDLFVATSQSQNADIASDKATSSGTEAIAFMSWEFATAGANDRYGLGLTLGTGLQSPGKSVYAGGTVRMFSRLLVTGGVVAARATRGEGAVAEPVSGTTGRELFASLKEISDTKPFWSISFKLY